MTWIAVAEAAVTALSLCPLLAITRGGWTGFSRATESVSSFARQALWLYGFYSHAFSYIQLVVCAALSLVYMTERRSRIRRNHRSHYGLLHVAEHLQILIYLAELVGGVDVSQCTITILCLAFVTAVVVPSISVLLINQWLWRNANKRLPNWFDERLLPRFKAKLAANTFNMKLQNVVTKLSGYLAPAFVSWERIEGLAASLVANEKVCREPSALPPFDLCVGVLSGGAFVTSAVANAWNIPERAYISSRLYSGQTLFGGWCQTLELFLGPKLSRRLLSLKPCYHAPVVTDLTLSETLIRMKINKKPLRRVLVVDDSVFSGRSLRAAREWVATATGLPLTCVSTAAMFVDGACAGFEPDYLALRGPVPWMWEWGIEVD